MKSFLDFLASYLEQEITLESVSSSNIMTFRAWLAKRRRNGIKPVSNARALSVVKNFFRYINKHHDIDNQAIFYVEQPNRRRNLPKALSLIDINEVAVAIKSKSGENWLTARDIAIIALLYGCGLRISEALLLKKQDAFSNEILITGKSNKGRVIPMLPIVMEKLSEYVKSCPYLSKNEMDSPLFLAKCGKPLKRTAFARAPCP